MSYFISDKHEEGMFTVVCSLTNANQHCECFHEKQDAINHIHYLNGGDGLTKRERFAMAAMQAYIGLREKSGLGVEEITSSAIKQADSLIKALEGES